MSDAPAFDPLPAGALRMQLPSLASIDAEGADAREFLHGQLSSDVKALTVGQAHYASYNSPKGRMLATPIVWRRADGHYMLVLAADLAEAIRRRLAMFVLRAKVVLAVSPRPLWGIVGAGAGDLGVPSIPAWSSFAADATAVLHLPDGRWLVDAGGALPQTIAALPDADEALWQWCAIRAGVAQIGAATSDKLVAQSANWELVGGVDFHKGCYPGQEIIARMQYLGRLKERLHAFHADAPAAALAAGTAVMTDGQDNGVGVGIVVAAAPSPAGGSDLLAVVHNDAAAAGVVAAGVRLYPRMLPYAVPALENARVKL
ncbi:MAG: folate-binding protein [Casimicrobiaceae bacterium]